MWNEDDKSACDRYNALIIEAQEHAADLRKLADHHHISVLKNSKGNLTLRAIRDRQASTSDWIEQRTLNKYLDADKQQKAKTKKAKELLAEVETSYRDRLNTDSLHEELADLQATVYYLELLDNQTILKSKVKEAKAVLNQLVYDKYPTLSVEEVKTLVVYDKWLPALAATVRGELNRVSRTLTGRVRQLAERYETPLPQLTDRVANLSSRVNEHLARMGALWN